MSYQFIDPSGDTISVSGASDGSITAECTNGTTTRFNPDGSHRSRNDPFGDGPLIFQGAPDGSEAAWFPDGSSRFVYPDGTVVHNDADGSSLIAFGNGDINHVDPGGRPTCGYALQDEINDGRITEVNVISTGNNVGTVAIIELVSDGEGDFVYVPPCRIVPDDTNTNQTIDTVPAICAIDGPGPYTFEVDGMCHEDPLKPPAESGDTGVRLDPVPLDDVSPYIGSIVCGAVGSGVIPGDLIGNPDDTMRTLDQVTRWMHTGAMDDVIGTFLIPRLPVDWSDDDKEQKIDEICDWGHQLVNKVGNFAKQQNATRPETPPGFFDASDQVGDSVSDGSGGLRGDTKTQEKPKDAKPAKDDGPTDHDKNVKKTEDNIRAIRNQMQEIYDRYKWNYSAKGGDDWRWKVWNDDKYRELQTKLKYAREDLANLTGDSRLPEEKEPPKPQPKAEEAKAPKSGDLPDNKTPPPKETPKPPPKGRVEP
jgi:hypothetical protein